ncbi:MAG: lipoate--protein ligase family protein [Candidatus Bipolaricaulota bacterium]
MRVLVERGIRPPEQALAMEEAILSEVARGDAPATLRLWRNGRCVVIGRSQDPEAEADVATCRSLGIPVLQRCSGGGTVYHHPGNLNFSLFLPLQRKWMAVRETQALFCGLLTEVLRTRWSLRASQRDGGVFVDGRKVSGSAQLRRRAFLHHGTLLLWEDELDMRRFLWAMSPGYRPSAVPSRPAPVADLSTLVGLPVGLEEGIRILLLAYRKLDVPSTRATREHGPAPH